MENGNGVFKHLIEKTVQKILVLFGVHTLAAHIFSHVFWRFIVRPIVKYAHRKGGLKIHKDKKRISIAYDPQNDRWTHLSDQQSEKD